MIKRVKHDCCRQKEVKVRGLLIQSCLYLKQSQYNVHSCVDLQAAVKTMLKTWSELYRTVSRLGSLVTSARANTLCEEVADTCLDWTSKASDTVCSDFFQANFGPHFPIAKSIFSSQFTWKFPNVELKKLVKNCLPF